MDNSLKKYLEANDIIVKSDKTGLHLTIKNGNLSDLKELFANFKQTSSPKPSPHKSSSPPKSSPKEEKEKSKPKPKPKPVPVIKKREESESEEEEEKKEQSKIKKIIVSPVKTVPVKPITPSKKKENLPSNTVRVIFTSKKKSSIKSLTELKGLSLNDVTKRRKEIYDDFMEEFDLEDPYPNLEPSMIAFLINKYDILFFDSLLSTQLKDKGLGMLAVASNLLTKTAGCETRVDNDFIIKISTKIIDNISEDNTSRLYANKVTHVQNRIDALMEIIEHELIHAMNALDPINNEMLESGTCELQSSHGNWFTSIVNRLFLHTQHRHNLIDFAGSNEAVKLDVQPKLGTKVSFVGKDRKMTNGTIVKLNPKKAQVRVAEGLIWNVPYPNLYKPI